MSVLEMTRGEKKDGTWSKKKIHASLHFWREEERKERGWREGNKGSVCMHIYPSRCRQMHHKAVPRARVSCWGEGGGVCKGGLSHFA